MPRRDVVLAFALLLALFLPGLPALASPTSDIVAEVSQFSYSSYLNSSLYAHTGDNRGYGAQHDLARTNIYNAFQSFGLTTSLDPFTYNSNTYYNVVGVLPGKTHPDQIYIVGAHYDSVNNPGADDNASGTAGVLEAARVLSQHAFESTLVFIAFDREEQGLYGSHHYADAHASDDIRGMISLDMIAYNPAGTHHDKAYVYWYSYSSPIVNDLADSLATYGGITAEIGNMNSSDHTYFATHGFDSALLIEHGWSNNPYYHKSTDAIETPGLIDYDYATRMTRGAVGYLAEEAGPIIPEPGGLVLITLTVLLFVRRGTTHRG